MICFNSHRLISMAAAGLLLFSACDKEKDVESEESATDTTSTVVVGGGGGGGGSSSDATAPEVGTGPDFSGITDSGFTVSWSAAKDDATEAADLEYKLVSAATKDALATLELAYAISGDAVSLDWTKATLSKQISGLSHLQKVAYAVLVRDATGNVGLYPGQEVTTLDGDAPTLGAAITFSIITHSTASIYWGAATSTMSAQAKLKYRVVIAPSASDIDTIAEAEALTGASVVLAYTENVLARAASGLNFGTVYYAAVLVKDEEGRTSIYTPASFETLHHRLIFSTSTSYPSTFISVVADADAACNAAKPANRTAAFKALISSAARTACTNAYCNPLVGGDLADWPLLSDTTYESADLQVIFTTGYLPITASGATINPIDGANNRTWTGIKSDWRDSTNNCLNWTSVVTSDKGDGGWSTNTSPAAWSGYDWNCSGSYKILCVEQ